jgi:O-antigen/teichoic acid export membrane protein
MRLFRSFLTLLAGEGGARILGVASFALLARSLSLADFGTFSFAMSTALMLAVFIDMGQNNHLGRLAGRGDSDVNSSLKCVLRNKCCLGGLGVFVVALGLRLVGFSPQEVLLVALMGVWSTLISMLDSLRAVVRASDMMRLDSAVNSIESLGRLAAVVLVGLLEPRVEIFAAAFIVEALIAVVVFSAVLSVRTPIRILGGSWADLPSVLGDSWALGIMGIAMAGFYRSDQLLVQGLAGAAENGLYGAATRIAFTAAVGGSLVVMAGYPGLARASKSPSAYASSLRRVVVLSFLVGAVAAVVVFLGADILTRVLYGPGFEGAAPILRVLSLVTFANSLALVGTYSASALGRERRAMRFALGMIAFNVLANVVLVPRFGALGAAWASAVGEAALAACMLWVSRDCLLQPERGVGWTPNADSRLP